jgi:hypothetical protein
VELLADLSVVMEALGQSPEVVTKAAPVNLVDELVSAHSQSIQAGLRAMVTPDQIKAAVAAYLAR